MTVTEIHYVYTMRKGGLTAEKLSTCPLCGLEMRGCVLASHLNGHAKGGWTTAQEIVDKYNEGWPFERITQHFHVGKKLICKMLNDNGIPIRPGYTHADEHLYTCPHCGRTMRGGIYAKHLRSHEEAGWETEQDIVDLHEYQSVAWIAKKLHLSRETVIEILTRHGVEVYGSGRNGREHYQPCLICGYPIRGCTRNQHMRSHTEGDWRKLSEIADAYTPGVSLRTLGQQFHAGAQHIKHMLIFHGVEIRPASAFGNQHMNLYTGAGFLTAKERERIFELYDSGFSMLTVAKNVTVSKHLVKKALIERYSVEALERSKHEPTPARQVLHYLKALESPLRPGTAYSTDRLTQDEIARTVYLYRDRELTLKEVGQILGIRGHTVHWRLRRAGVPARTRQENYAMLGRKARARNDGKHLTTGRAD